MNIGGSGEGEMGSKAMCDPDVESAPDSSCLEFAADEVGYLAREENLPADSGRDADLHHVPIR